MYAIHLTVTGKKDHLKYLLRIFTEKVLKMILYYKRLMHANGIYPVGNLVVNHFEVQQEALSSHVMIFRDKENVHVYGLRCLKINTCLICHKNQLKQNERIK